MNCNTLPFIPNPVSICQNIYGKINVNEVRDATISSLRRFYGWECDINNRLLYEVVQGYLIKILTDAGKNPKAVKLAIPPLQFEPAIFPKYYIATNYDKEKALKLSIDECIKLSRLSFGMSEKCLLNCYIDYHSV